MTQTSKHYNKEPIINVKGYDDEAWAGYSAISGQIADMLRARSGRVISIECYPGVREEEILNGIRAALRPTKVVHTKDGMLSQDALESLVARYITDDRVFGYMSPILPDELFDSERTEELRGEINETHDGNVIVIGFGASLIVDADVLVYADLSRWEIQQRFRSREFGNLYMNNYDEDILRKYKRGYFFEWRVADRLKRAILTKMDFYIDTHVRNKPKMTTGRALLSGLKQTARRPFRLVPYFDPGVWGGTWLSKHIDLPPTESPYAWGFDGVPEENSLYFNYGDIRIELPAINLVFYQPKQLLGEKVYARFGAEFPIRFDFLDTMGGQNLSLQVHPSTEYIKQTFGMAYTQDESYYILDAEPDAYVYLGLKTDVDKDRMTEDLVRAQSGSVSFPADNYVNQYPAKKHDHFLIPAGTIHCSGQGCLVLEISATPYIFTFKLWDWDRFGLDGKPRPIHLDHGLRNICWDRTTEWVSHELVNVVQPMAHGDGFMEERTGLHEFEFIETRRHWFSKPVIHQGNGSVQMLNLVEGQEAMVDSPEGEFDPFIVHYAETFIIPASIKSFRIQPFGNSVGERVATIKAYVRT